MKPTAAETRVLENIDKYLGTYGEPPPARIRISKKTAATVVRSRKRQKGPSLTPEYFQFKTYKNIPVIINDVIAVDFEFRMPNMGYPVIRCLSALSLKTGQRWDYWADEIPARPPFSFGPDTVYLMHFGEAELACFQVLGWGFPAFIFDSYTVISQLRARPAKKISQYKTITAPVQSRQKPDSDSKIIRYVPRYGRW